MRGYDSHLNFCELNKFDAKISIIPNRKPHGIFLSKDLMFIDSMQFMNSSLDKLVKILSDNYFTYLVNKTHLTMADKVTLWTEEKLTTLIEKIMARALYEQKKNLLNIISGNFEILKQQTAELKKEINELRYSIEHTENVLEDKVVRVHENLGHIENGSN